MPGMNAIALATNAAVTFTSATIRIQGVRDEAITFWLHVESPSGARAELRGAPEDSALLLGGHNGMILHTVITTGTAGPGQTKVNGQGFASVTLQALPLMFLYWAGGLGTDRLTAWLIE